MAFRDNNEPYGNHGLRFMWLTSEVKVDSLSLKCRKLNSGECTDTTMDGIFLCASSCSYPQFAPGIWSYCHLRCVNIRVLNNIWKAYGTEKKISSTKRITEKGVSEYRNNSWTAVPTYNASYLSESQRIDIDLACRKAIHTRNIQLDIMTARNKIKKRKKLGTRVEQKYNIKEDRMRDSTD